MCCPTDLGDNVYPLTWALFTCLASWLEPKQWIHLVQAAVATEDLRSPAEDPSKKDLQRRPSEREAVVPAKLLGWTCGDPASSVLPTGVGQLTLGPGHWGPLGARRYTAPRCCPKGLLEKAEAEFFLPLWRRWSRELPRACVCSSLATCLSNLSPPLLLQFPWTLTSASGTEAPPTAVQMHKL